MHLRLDTRVVLFPPCLDDESRSDWAFRYCILQSKKRSGTQDSSEFKVKSF